MILRTSWLKATLASIGVATAFGYASTPKVGRVPSERRLVRVAKAGGRQAFDELMSEHALSLRRFVARKVSPQELDDVIQDTWLAAWEGIGRFNGSGRFRTWLFGIANNKVKDYWRGRAASPNAAPETAVEPSYTPSAFATVELREILHVAWKTLPADQQEVLDLYYFGGLTLAETARVLGRNLNTVKYQFYRAHDTVANQLRPFWEANQRGTT